MKQNKKGDMDMKEKAHFEEKAKKLLTTTYKEKEINLIQSIALRSISIIGLVICLYFAVISKISNTTIIIIESGILILAGETLAIKLLKKIGEKIIKIT